MDEGEHRIKIELHADIFGCGVEALKFEGAGDNLVQLDTTTLQPGVPGGEQELAQDCARPLCFLEYLAYFVGMASRIPAQEKALRVAKDACERVAEFVSYTGDHLAELRELFCLQQLGLKDPLGSEVTVDFDVADERAFFINNGTSGTFKQAWNGPH
jgi:hypothetical protein